MITEPRPLRERDEHQRCREEDAAEQKGPPNAELLRPGARMLRP